MKLLLHAAAIFALLSSTAALGDDTICFEAEEMQGVTEPMEIVDTTALEPEAVEKSVKGCSGGKYLQILLGKGKAPKVSCQATFEFEVSNDATYYLWCRAMWDGECSNSFSISLDDAAPFVFGEDATFNTWHWIKAPPRLKQLKLNAGKHKITIKNREDGVKLDQVLLVSDKSHVPVAAEPVTAKSSLPAK